MREEEERRSSTVTTRKYGVSVTTRSSVHVHKIETGVMSIFTTQSVLNLPSYFVLSRFVALYLKRADTGQARQYFPMIYH